MLPFLNSLDQIVDTVNVNDFETAEIGRETRRTSTNIRAGRRGQPTELAQLALANLKILITQGSVPILPKRWRRGNGT